MSRRLPVYLLIDCSGSMVGTPIESVRVGVSTLVDELMGDPTACDAAWLSVITFSGTVKELVPLTPLSKFSVPDFDVDTDRPGTFLGQALELLATKARENVQKKTSAQQGDWLPLVFILTDGKPSDTAAYKEMAEKITSGKIRELQSKNIIACAAGPQASADDLRKLTDKENVLVLSNVAGGEISKYFAFASMMTSSKLGSMGVQPSVGDTARNAGFQTLNV